MLSIDIGSRYIKILSGEVKARNIDVKNRITVRTPDFAMDNGIIVNREIIAETLHKTIEENGLKGKKAVVVLNSPEVMIREINLPKTNKTNMDIIVSNEMESFLGEESYATDYFMQMQEEGIAKAFIFSLPSDTVQMYKKLLTDCGLTPYALDISSNAIRKLLTLGNLLGKSEGCLDVIADIGYHFINFNIFNKKLLIYSRCVRLDVNDQVKEYIDSLIEKTRAELELDIDFTAYLSSVGDEIQKILQFLLSSDFKDIGSKVYLIGGASRFDGIAFLLSEYLGREICLIQSAKKRAYKSWDLKEYSCAMGALIRL